MQREFIIIFGNQGEGKTVWAKSYARHQKRLLVFDPVADYTFVDYATPPDEWQPGVINGGLKSFRFGTYYQEELPLFAHTAFAAGDCTFLIEECALIFKRGEELHDWAKPLVFMGRHRRVNLVLVAQRATKIPIDIRSQANRIITFKQTEPNDVSALGERMGNNVENEIPSLQKLHCLDLDLGTMALRRYSVAP